jgi:DNA-binding NtrC family response regulator
MLDRRFTVLIAVDDDTVSEFLAAFIQERGCAVSLARNAEKALERMEEMQVGVVFADLAAPNGIDSFGLAMIIAEKQPGIPTICASAEPVRRTGSVECTMVPKPYRCSDLMNALKEVAPDYLS